MRVSVYKLEGGEMAVLIEASPGSGKAPVMLPGITLENVVSRVLPELDKMRSDGPTPTPPPL